MLHTTVSCDEREPGSNFGTGPGRTEEDLVKPRMEHVPGSGLKRDKTLGLETHGLHPTLEWQSGLDWKDWAAAARG